ncbi:6-bladed beta-propeller [Chitinophaga tropicalis]|uniref:6-bladed beta-propeller n=1 Tax=Chitinophaga tropicalis TaxID=2683588 RepID=A0A7K1U6M7_9BACT|nr:6-bladed beta-propeller [Chitinophaga tropicalis]MVT10007.1 6-bladed beta-propeller [Chitinophaga tropicalis]
MKNLFWLSAFLIIAGCRQHESPADLSKVPKINIGATTDSVNNINIKGTSSIVCLGQIPGAIIGSISKLYAGKSHYVIFDKVRNVIYIYDKSGRFLRQIGDSKKEQNPYGAITDMVYYPETDHIEVYYIAKRMMVEYEITGKKLSERRSQFYFLSFYKAKEGYWIYGCFEENKPRRFYSMDVNRYNLLLVSHDLRKIKAGFCKAMNFYDRTDGNDNFLTNSKGELFFKYGFSDVLYRIEGEKAYPYLRFDFGAAQLPYEYLSNISNNKEFQSLLYEQDIKYNGLKYKFQLGDQLIYFGCSPYRIASQKQQTLVCFMDSLRYKSGNYPDTAFNPGLLSIPVAIQDKKIYYTVIPALLNEHQLETFNRRYHTQVKPDSNPLLLINDEENIF